MTKITHSSLTPLLSVEKAYYEISSYNNKNASENTALFDK